MAEPVNCTGTNDRRLGFVGDHVEQCAPRTRRADRACMERLREILIALWVLARPLANRVSGPLRRLLGVTVVARGRTADLRGDIGPRNTHRMIMPWIDHHIRHR